MKNENIAFDYLSYLPKVNKIGSLSMKYEDIVFMQDSDADEVLSILDEYGEDKALQYLSQWDYGESPVKESGAGAPFGISDRLYQKDNYVMSYNRRIGYIGLIKLV